MAAVKKRNFYLSTKIEHPSASDIGADQYMLYAYSDGRIYVADENADRHPISMSTITSGGQEVFTLELSGGIPISLVSNASGAHDLGSSDRPWRNLYLGNKPLSSDSNDLYFDGNRKVAFNGEIESIYVDSISNGSISGGYGVSIDTENGGVLQGVQTLLDRTSPTNIWSGVTDESYDKFLQHPDDLVVGLLGRNSTDDRNTFVYWNNSGSLTKSISSGDWTDLDSSWEIKGVNAELSDDGTKIIVVYCAQNNPTYNIFYRTGDIDVDSKIITWNTPVLLDTVSEPTAHVAITRFKHTNKFLFSYRSFSSPNTLLVNYVYDLDLDVLGNSLTLIGENTYLESESISSVQAVVSNEVQEAGAGNSPRHFYLLQRNENDLELLSTATESSYQYRKLVGSSSSSLLDLGNGTLLYAFKGAETEATSGSDMYGRYILLKVEYGSSLTIKNAQADTFSTSSIVENSKIRFFKTYNAFGELNANEVVTAQTLNNFFATALNADTEANKLLLEKYKIDFVNNKLNKTESSEIYSPNIVPHEYPNNISVPFSENDYITVVLKDFQTHGMSEWRVKESFVNTGEVSEFLGISATDSISGELNKILLKGIYSTSGLIPGSKYYVDLDGTITNVLTEFPIGSALSETQLYVDVISNYHTILDKINDDIDHRLFSHINDEQIHFTLDTDPTLSAASDSVAVSQKALISYVEGISGSLYNQITGNDIDIAAISGGLQSQITSNDIDIAAISGSLNDYALISYVDSAISGAGNPLEVSSISGADVAYNQFYNVDAIRFDSDSGFDVVDLGNGQVKVQMNSTFKFIEVEGQDTVVAQGLDTLQLIQGDGIQILTDATDPKSITFSVTGAGFGPITDDVSGYYDLLDDRYLGQYGSVECVTGQSVYTVTHEESDIYPITSLAIPESGSAISVIGITNKTSTSFDIILSQEPLVPGYKINWYLNSSGIIYKPVQDIITGQYGVEDCNIGQLIYTIEHDPSSTYPIASLNIPTSGDTISVLGITNKKETSFDVVLSNSPSISGYKISWYLNNNGFLTLDSILESISGALQEQIYSNDADILQLRADVDSISANGAGDFVPFADYDILGGSYSLTDSIQLSGSGDRGIYINGNSGFAEIDGIPSIISESPSGLKLTTTDGDLIIDGGINSKIQNNLKIVSTESITATDLTITNLSSDNELINVDNDGNLNSIGVKGILTTVLATSGSNIIDSTIDDTVEWLVKIKYISNVKTVKILGSHNGSTSEYNQYETIDLGDTSPVELSVDYSSSIRLLATISDSNTWTVSAYRNSF